MVYLVLRSSSSLLKMAAARNKQLEDKLAQYERIMNGCSRCKAASGLEGSEDSTSVAVAPPPADPSQQNALGASSTASALSSKKPLSSNRQGPTTRSSNKAPSTSKVKPSSSFHPQTSSTSQPKHTSLRPSPNTVNASLADTDWVNQSRPILSRSDSDAGRPRDDIRKEASWVASADKMLDEVPFGWEWLARLVRLGNSMLAAVAIDTTAVLNDVSGAEDDTRNKDHLLRLVQGFAHRHSEQRVNFQHFLLVCLCIVLSAQGIPRDSIVEALKMCVGDNSEGNIVKYLEGAKWANELMNSLFFTDWGYRAIDLLLLCM